MAWNRLPEHVLAHIYGYLDQRDRVAASEVCMPWHHALYAPFLWRAMTLHLDRDLLQAADPELRTVNEPIALHLTNLFGQHLRHLELVWPRHLSLPRLQFPPGAQVEAAIAFLALLRYQNVQLKGLVLTDWEFSYKAGHRGKLISKLVKFLNSQRNLEILSMKNARFRLGEGMRLLAAVVKASNSILYQLDLCGAFKHGQTAHSNTKYLWSLEHLRALTNIRLDYSALSDEVLSIFSQQAVLTYLHVSVRDIENHHVLSDHAWNLLRTACPNLKVSFSLVNIAYYETTCHILLPSIPLCKFQLLSDFNMYQHRSQNFRSTLRLLPRYYADTLESIHLRIKDTQEMLDDLLLQLLSICCHLSHLQYEGILCNMETVRQMCIMQDNKMTNFHTMHVKPRILNTTNQQIVRDIRSQFTNKLAEQDVDFKIEDPSSVIGFY